jgi:Sigma-54 interaction domain
MEEQMMTRRDFDFELSDTTVLTRVSFKSRKPSMLIVVTEKARETVTDQLAASCSPPVHICRLPGTLYLPAVCGTLVLSDPASLEMNQQLALYDWISRHHPSRVLSITSTDIPSLVRDGLFLEGLYYRLNMIRVDARAQLPPVRALEDAGSPCLWS